jgi:hypothetical protein
MISHPADDARMKTMLFALRGLGHTSEVDSIYIKWNELITISGAKADAEYRRCFSEFMLERMVVVSSKLMQGRQSVPTADCSDR